MKQLTELQKAFGSTPPEVHCAIERAFVKGEVQMKKRHKLMMVLPIAACLIAAIAVALAAGNHASPQPDVLAAPVLENTESPQPETCVYFTDEGFTGFEENCYHAVQDCGGMIGARAGTVDEAVALGKFPCPVCLADAVVPADNEIYGGNTERPLPESNVYFTKGGKYYHAVQDCGGMMGAQIPREFIVEILERLGCKVSDSADPDVLDVVSPTFRPDLPREIDLYEEVLRLYGMDLIPETLPGGRGRFGVRSHMEHVLATINRTMCASGLNETMTYSFAEHAELDRLRMPEDGLGDAVELINPMNADQSVMRQSIIPGLLRSVAHNQARGVKNIQLYEQGMVFYAHEGRKQPKERRKLAGVMAGAFADAGWNQQPATFDFFDGKGAVENLMRELAIPKVRYKALSADEAPHLQPGRAAQVLTGGTVLGWVGEVHPLACAAYDAQAPVVAFELDVDALAKAARPARDYVDVPTFPAVSIDQAFVVDESVTHERLEQCMTSAGGKLLSDVRLFDVYRDEERIGTGKKSMAYALTYRAADRTLTSEEVDKAHTKLVKKVCGATGAEVRG